MGYLHQNSHAVARLARRVLPGSVLQLFYYRKRVINHLVAFCAVHIHNRAYTAGVVLKLLSVKSLFGHLKFPRFKKN